MIKKVRINEFSYLILLIGLIVFSLGVIYYFQNKSEKKDTMINTSLVERDLAIAEAIRTGQKEYSYTTNFTPGVGRIENPEEYKKAWEEQAKEQIDQEVDLKQYFKNFQNKFTH